MLYFEDGKQARIEMSYRGGKLAGERRIYYKNGQLRHVSNFVDGQLDGKATNWDRSGNKISEMTFEGGKVKGRPVSWGADGSPNEQGHREQDLASPSS